MTDDKADATHEVRRVNFLVKTWANLVKLLIRWRDKRGSRVLCICFAFINFLLVLLVFYQSQLYILLRAAYLNPEDLNNHIMESIALREEVMKARRPANTPYTPRIIAHVMFDEGQRSLIEKASQELINDPEVQKVFPNIDGCDIRQTDAVVVPLWKFENDYDWPQMGITKAAYVWTKNDYGYADGLTIRERSVDLVRVKALGLDSEKYEHIKGNGTPRMTEDGTPRIFLAQHLLNKSKFQKLKFTLLHEFVHAHQVPGFKPWLNFVHHDLIYLPQYRSMIERLNLDSEKRYTEYAQRLFIVLCLLLTAWYTYLAGLGEPSR